MYKFINDRSNLDEVISVTPNKDNDTVIKNTRRMELEKGYMPRADVVLISNTRTTKQYALYVSMEGFKGDTWILDILSDNEYEQVIAIAERMRKNAMVFSPAFKLL